MFDPTLDNMALEIEAAEKETDQYTAAMPDMCRRYGGRWFRADEAEMDGDDADPENFAYMYVSNTLGKLVVSNPQVRVEGERVVGYKIIAQAMTDGTNAWIRQINYAKRIERVVMDFLFSRGVLLHYLQKETRTNRGAVCPAVARIDPRRFFMDSLTESPEDAEFMGHWYYQDLDDILADPNVLPETLEYLSAQGKAEQDRETWEKPDPTQMGRKRVQCYVVWLRNKNTLRVMARGSKWVQLYEEMPFYGPPTGPYQLFDAYPMPDSPWPVSPLVAVEDQSRDLNAHARAMGRAAARRKSLVLVEANNPDLGNKLTDAEDGTVVPVKGLTGQSVQVEIGGATQEQYSYTEYLRNRLDRVMGLTATIQGSVGQADTATEAQIAADALDDRMKYLQRAVVGGVQESLLKVDWWLFNTEGIVIPVNRRDSYTGQQIEGLFFGGPMPSDMGTTIDDYNLRVAVYSLQQDSPQARQAKVMAFFQVFMAIMQAAPAMPWVRWMNVLRDVGEAHDMADKADEWCIPEMLGAFSQPELMPPSAVLGPAPMGSQQQSYGKFGQPTMYQLNPRNQQGGAPGAPGGGQLTGSGMQPGQPNAMGRTTGPRPPGSQNPRGLNPRQRPQQQQQGGGEF